MTEDAPVPVDAAAPDGAPVPVDTDAPVDTPAPAAGGTRELLALVDRLEELLVRSDLAELEVEVGGTAIVLRRPVAVPDAGAAAIAAQSGAIATPDTPGREEALIAADRLEGRHAVLAPLTGIFYTAPAPGAEPYLHLGDTVSVGQVIGLIEAMKLFNEIKSDITGTLTRIVAETGSLVKQKQPLIEVEPS